MNKRNMGDESTRVVMDHLRRVVQVLRVAARHAEKKAGISGTQLFVLTKLADAGRRALSVNELAERTLTHQSSVSVVVTKLVELGLIERALAEEDRRRWELTLTPKARALIRKAPASPQDRIVEGLNGMDPSHRQQLAQLLGELVSHLGGEKIAAAMLFEPAVPPNNVAAVTEKPLPEIQPAEPITETPPETTASV